MLAARIVLALAFVLGFLLSVFQSPPVGISVGGGLLLVWLEARRRARAAALTELDLARREMDGRRVDVALDRLLKLTPEDARTASFVALQRGVARLMDEDFDGATEPFEVALRGKLDPRERLTARANLAYCQAMRGVDTVAAAREVAAEAEAFGPEAAAGPLAVLGGCLLARGQSREALQIFLRVEAASVGQPASWRGLRLYFLAEALAAEGFGDEARARYAEAAGLANSHFRRKAEARLAALQPR